MKRRINSTGRRSINRNQIIIRLIDPEEAGQPRSFEADLSGLAELDVPRDCHVYVEPYVTGSTSMMRFDFGTIGKPETPASTLLSDLDSDGRVLFRIKVVDQAGEVGKIVAHANALRSRSTGDAEDDSRAILPVAHGELGEIVWRMEFEGQERPTLVINNRVPGLMDRLKNDPLLQGAILPAAISEIFRRILDANRPDGNDDLDWVQDWRTWASGVLDDELGDDTDDVDELENRLDLLKEGFASASKFVSKLDLTTASEAIVSHDE
jgi:hypothetical protein